MRLFIHGVPDTPVVWRPLLDALDLKSGVLAPPVPGLATRSREGFEGTPAAHVDWLISHMEQAAAKDGPVDLVGHDWGALFVVRAASLRPELVRSWTAANAVPDPTDPWPLIARLWGTPVLGDLLMAISPSSGLERALKRQRMSQGMAAHEAAHWKRESRRAILKLYRSGKRIGAEWDADLSRLPGRGLVIWSAKDPYTSPRTAELFCARTGATLRMLEKCGHWSIVECPQEIAMALKARWRS